MAGGVSGAASGGILGLALLLLLQQLGYIDFADTLLGPIELMILSIVVFAIVFGFLGRWLKGSALRRARSEAGAAAATDPPTSEPPASPP